MSDAGSAKSTKSVKSADKDKQAPVQSGDAFFDEKQQEALLAGSGSDAPTADQLDQETEMKQMGPLCGTCKHLLFETGTTKDETVEKHSRIVLGLLSHYSDSLMAVLKRPPPPPGSEGRSRRDRGNAKGLAEDDEEEEGGCSCCCICCTLFWLVILSLGGVVLYYYIKFKGAWISHLPPPFNKMSSSSFIQLQRGSKTTFLGIFPDSHAVKMMEERHDLTMGKKPLRSTASNLVELNDMPSEKTYEKRKTSEELNGMPSSFLAEENLEADVDDIGTSIDNGDIAQVEVNAKGSIIL